jgi:hypothetical protein
VGTPQPDLNHRHSFRGSPCGPIVMLTPARHDCSSHGAGLPDPCATSSDREVIALASCLTRPLSAECCGDEWGAHRNLVGLGKALKGESGTAAAHSAAAAASTEPLARAEALAMLREDYDQGYFVSGKGSMTAYAPDCTFADPFVAFDGVRRFQANVANLGGLMEDIDLKITNWEETDEALQTSWRFSCVLALPWRPKLAAAGGTTHVFDGASGRVIKHVERWDVEPGKVVKELLCVRTALKCRTRGTQTCAVCSTRLALCGRAASWMSSDRELWLQVHVVIRIEGLSVRETSMTHP